jgi:hypothetical protein
MFDEHEATVSRKLERVRRGLRQQVERTLRDEFHLSEAQVSACFEYALEDTGFDFERLLRPGQG